MGTLANSVFQTLLGWVRAVTLEIWNTFSSPEGTTFLEWVAARWKGIALAFCAAGAAIDLAVYLLRWQPYRVWRSRRNRRRAEREKPEPKEAEEPAGEPETYGESGSFAGELPLTAAAELAPSLIRQARQDSRENAAGETERRGVRRRIARYVENAYDGDPAEDRADRPREWEGDAEADPPEEEYRPEPAEEPESAGRITEKFEQAIRLRRRRSVRAMLSDRPEEETETPDQLIDRNEAYRRPVYPRGWTEEEER
ncbi:MAG: hypothetical protein IKE24_11170 [Clostridia bacterium]|nr:hypothetical protein [Clostridia bacterium]